MTLPRKGFSLVRACATGSWGSRTFFPVLYFGFPGSDVTEVCSAHARISPVLFFGFPGSDVTEVCSAAAYTRIFPRTFFLYFFSRTFFSVSRAFFLI